MDSLTQIVLGAAVGEAVLGRKIGNKAILWGAIAGTIPDLDVLLIGDDPIRELTIHRGFSHSIVFAILMAPILGWVVSWLYRKKNDADFKAWSWFFFWTIFTHPLLDCLTTYGTQLFLPFSDYRVSISSVFVLDFFYTIPFLASIIALMFFARQDPKRRLLNRIGIVVSSVYLILGLTFKYVAQSKMETSLEEQGIPFSRGFTSPTPLNIILWSGVFESDSSFYICNYSLLDEIGPIEFWEYPKAEQLITPINHEYGVDRLKWFSDQYYTATQTGDTINFYTLKFGRHKFDSHGADGSFAFYFKIYLDSSGNVTGYENFREMEANNIGDMLGQLKSRTLGDKGAYSN
ncbi:MAG: inner membrane protein [Flavobacteriales bacterium]|jgi:inner membrane protein